jgi:Orsellinic acid/F9775 biosynthesis cluster protein D
MASFERLFRHVPEHRVALCRQCAIAIPPTQVFTHLREHHPSVPVSVRREVVAAVGGLADLAWQPDDVLVPKPATTPIEGLPLCTDGLVCLSDACWYTCRTLRGIREHCEKKHGWVDCQRRGGDARRKSKQSDNRMWKDEQVCQRLFKAAGWPAYFPLREAGVESAEEGDVAAVLVPIGRAELQHRRRERDEAERKRGIQEGSRCPANARIEFTGRPTHDKRDDSIREEREQEREEGGDGNGNGNDNEDTTAAIGQGPWATQSELQVLRQAPAIPWPGCLALFGRPGRLEKTEQMEEQKTILEHIQAKEALANRYFQSFSRLSFGQQFTRWRNVGCQLCYVNTGRPEPDHAMGECNLWASCRRARDIQRWLERLPIPEFAGGLGCCSLCTLTDSPCDAVRLGCRAAEAESPESQAFWIKQLQSRCDSNSHCENTPVVRKAIAALSAYDEQILGKVLAERFSEKDGVEFHAENQVSFWFSGKVPFQGGWVPRILFIFEMLVWAFDFRSKERRQTLEAALCPNELRPMGWDNKEEVQSWQESLEWWVGKCGFCAGKGLFGVHIHHTLHNCSKGGAASKKTELGECIYLEGLKAQGGCQACGVPREFCQRWRRKHDGKWDVLPTAQCQYQSLVYDTVVGLFHCGDDKYRMEVSDTILEQGDEEYMELGEEDVASWLSTRLTVEGLECSYFMRTFTIWTWMVRQTGLL